MRLLVAGAGGMLGRDVVAAARERGHDVVALARGELDITDADAVARAVVVGVDAVVNCAAWTDVDGAESAAQAALVVNGGGAAALARAASAVGAQVVHVSTDYVFDGTAARPYVESDPVGPVSAYGRTKLAGERAVLGVDPGHAVVRSAWLFGAGGRNFAATMLGLADGGRPEVAVVTDQVGCPTYTGHLAPALVTIAERRGGGVHHVAGGGQCSWHELAVAVFAAAGLDVHVRETTSAEFVRPARRPAWSVLRSERGDAIELADWRAGVSAYLEELGRVGVAPR